MAAIVEHPAIIPATSEVYQEQQPDGELTGTDIEKQNKNAPVAPEELATLIEKLKQEPFLETSSPAAPQSPPPPYSQWDELNLENLEQLLQKSREVLNGHSEFLAQSGNQKEINADMIEKMTQLESLVSSLQAKLKDQTFAMHDLKSQLSDVQNVLKNMQDSKQETMNREEVMQQLIAMKQLYENIIASTETIAQNETIEEESQEELQLPTEEIIPSFLPSSPPDSSLSVILMPPSRPMSRTTSRQTSRAPSRAPSRSGSRSASRTVSPVRSPALSRSSSKIKLDLPPAPVSPSMRPFKGPTMGPINEDGGDNDDNDDDNDDDDGDESNDEDNVAFERMSSMLLTLITEATTAVEAPVKGREKVRQSSNASTVSRDYFEDFDWDALADEEESVVDQTEVVEKKVEVVKGPRRREKKNHHHKRSKSKKEEEFEESFKSLDSSLTQVQCLITDMTDELMEEEEAVIKQDSNGMLFREIKDKNGVVIREEPVVYRDPTQELINNPSADWADLDDFAQQCRLLTRALILPFLHATHSFMSESLKTTSQENSPRSVTGTTRTFLNLIYWTFLFTLGSLVLDAWLCEVAGRQVIRMVDMLKPGQPFGLVQNPQPVYEIENDRQNYGYNHEYGVRMVDDGKKKKRQNSYGL